MKHVSAKSHSLVQREVYLPQLDVMVFEGKLNNCFLVPTNKKGFKQTESSSLHCHYFESIFFSPFGLNEFKRKIGKWRNPSSGKPGLFVSS